MEAAPETSQHWMPEDLRDIFMEAINSARWSPATTGVRAFDLHVDGRGDHMDQCQQMGESTGGSDSYNESFKPRTRLPRTQALRSFAAYQPDSPSPLRHVVNGNRNRQDHDSKNSTPPSMPRVPTTPDTSYQVPGEFLNAMIGLLERQANIVPEHLYTQADLEEARETVRRETLIEMEMKMGEKAPSLAVHSVSESSTWSGTSVTVLGSVTALVVGAGIGLFRRACLAHPELTWHYVNGAWKGAACGLVGVLLFKGMLDTFDGRRGFYI